MTGKFVTRSLIATVLILAVMTITGCSIVYHESDERSGGCAGDRQYIVTNAGKEIRLEHVAINVEDPIAMAKWYCENLGMKIVRKGPPPANAHFISDAGGNMMLEIYHNPPDAVPDYFSMNPLLLHIAFMVDDVKGISRKLVAAGATIATDVTITDAGDELVMLRDPWGVPIQFLKRAEPML